MLHTVSALRGPYDSMPVGDRQEGMAWQATGTLVSPDFISACLEAADTLPGMLIVVATDDGVLLFSNWLDAPNTRIGAIIASAVGLGRRMADDFAEEVFEEKLVWTDEKIIGFFAVGNHHVLGLISDRDVTLTMLRKAARKAAGRIQLCV